MRLENIVTLYQNRVIAESFVFKIIARRGVGTAITCKSEGFFIYEK